MKTPIYVSKNTLFPILFGFFVMGFVDVVGIAANYVKKDFVLSETLTNLLPMMVFFWFAVFSIPAGVMMSKIGKKNTVATAMLITIVAMILPMCSYSFLVVLFAFALLGIGNTILQVTLNPMVAGLISGNALASVLTLGQFLKAVSSFLGPLIAGGAASLWGDWKLIFPVYAIVTLISMLWLLGCVHENASKEVHVTSFSSAIGLFKDRYILMLFLGILFVVGIDVGLNTTIPKLLMERVGLSLDEAGLGTSLYFSARTIGTFVGTFLLVRISSGAFLKLSMLLSIPVFIGLLSFQSLWLLCTMIVLVGLLCANVFSILFSCALQHKPEYDSEISALMIMGVSGGALVPLLMGVVSDGFSLTAGMAVLLLCLLYLALVSFRIKKV
jgi:FHS family L-fucose permease-like MFS transporter